MEEIITYSFIHPFSFVLFPTLEGLCSTDSYMNSTNSPNKRLFCHLIDILILPICNLISLLFILKHLLSLWLEIFSDLQWQTVAENKLHNLSYKAQVCPFVHPKIASNQIRLENSGSQGA